MPYWHIISISWSASSADYNHPCGCCHYSSYCWRAYHHPILGGKAKSITIDLHTFIPCSSFLVASTTLFGTLPVQYPGIGFQPVRICAGSSLASFKCWALGGQEYISWYSAACRRSPGLVTRPSGYQQGGGDGTQNLAANEEASVQHTCSHCRWWSSSGPKSLVALWPRHLVG